MSSLVVFPSCSYPICLTKGVGVVFVGRLLKPRMFATVFLFAEVLARKYFDDGSLYHRSIVKAISYLNGVIDLLYSAGMFLSDAEKVELSNRLIALGRYHMIARECAREAGELHFIVRPKAHYVQHLGDQCDLINSRYTSNYAEESLVGKLCKIFRSTANGRYHGRAQTTVLLKYLVYLAADLERTVTDSIQT